MPRHYDWVFLDVGDTLLQMNPPWIGFAAVLAELGHDYPRDQLVEAVRAARVGLQVEDHIEPGAEYAISAERAHARRQRFLNVILEAVGVPPACREACRQALWDSFVGPRHFRVFDDVPGTLESLAAAGYRLGIISNWDPRLPRLCEAVGLSRCFEFVLASEAEGFAKPGPHLFRRALRLANVTPERAVHVGDSYDHDVVGATGLGISAVLLDRGGYYAPGQWRPTISSLVDLPALLASGLS